MVTVLSSVDAYSIVYRKYYSLQLIIVFFLLFTIPLMVYMLRCELSHSRDDKKSDELKRNDCDVPNNSCRCLKTSIFC